MTSTDSSAAEKPAKAPATGPWDLPDVSGLVVGVLGGTGPQGKGLAYRFARAGQKVILGSRAAERAQAAAEELGHGVEGAENAECARRSDIVIVAVPWEGHGKTLESLRDELAGKLVVDCVNPLGFDKKGAYALKPEEGSAAEQAAAPAAGVPGHRRLPPPVGRAPPGPGARGDRHRRHGPRRGAGGRGDGAGAGRPHPRHARRLRRPGCATRTRSSRWSPT
ncbi:hypothetical protein GCM10020295_59990 [Streptomyces cinereospinus]